MSIQSIDAFSPLPFSATLTSAKPSLPKETPTKEEAKAIQLEQERKARDNHNNEAFNSLFVPVPERPDPAPCTVSKGELPPDFPPGCLMRIGPNGATAEEGFLDGDGMIHCVTFPPTPDSTSMYSSTYVDTRGRQREAARAAKYKGSLGAAPRGLPLLKNLLWNMVTLKTLQAQKDTANTALAEHGGRVLALMEQSPPTEIMVQKDGRVRTIESMTSLNGAIPNSDPITGGSLSAHGRTCPQTGDRVHISYSSSSAPYARIDVFSVDGKEAGWNLKQSQPVDIPTPVMIHDCAITPNYSLVLDFPLTIRPKRMLSDLFPVEYEPENGARIGLVPRGNAEKKDIMWFDCEPGVILHTVNAFETDDNKVVLHALRSEPLGEKSYITDYATTFLHEYTLDLLSGETTEQCLNMEELVEFPVIDEDLVGKDADHVYCAAVSAIGGPLKVHKSPAEGILLDGIVKFALKDNDVTGNKKGDVVGRFTLPENWYSVSEPTVVKKRDDKGTYVVMIATQVPKGVSFQQVATGAARLRSQVLVLDGDDLNCGPVCTLRSSGSCPVRVALFIPGVGKDEMSPHMVVDRINCCCITIESCSFSL